MRPTPILCALLAAVAGCGGGGGGGSTTPPPPPEAVDATVTIDNRAAVVQAAPAVNRRVLGSNLQWTDGGDGLLTAGTNTFAAGPLGGATALAPTVLRFPGGGQADAYVWQHGIGPDAGRGTSLHVFTDAMQTVHFGSDEFIDLCQQTGADPLITVNIVNAAASDSAAWVAHVNGGPPTGTAPVVRDWEIGNEPYLENSQHPTWDMTAAQFAAAYDAHAAAVIAADPRVRVGLPVLGAITAALLPPARQTWNADVLGTIAQRVDFVAIHDAYLPFLYTHPGTQTDAEMLRSTLAGAPAVNADLDTVRSQLTAHGITAPFAMTEHNALMTVYGTFSPIPRSDGIPASLAGAVYTADLVCTLASRDDVDSAEHWSLIGNWMFGAMAWDGTPRPSYRAFEGLGSALVGRRVPTAVAGPTADVPAFGALPAQTAMPLVSAFTAGSGATLRCVLVNRSPDRAMRVRLACRGGATAGATVTVKTLDAADPLLVEYDGSGTPGWTTTTATADAHGVAVDLPAHALVIVLVPAPTGGIPDPAPSGPG